MLTLNWPVQYPDYLRAKSKQAVSFWQGRQFFNKHSLGALHRIGTE
jgi:hypothetical protein